MDNQERDGIRQQQPNPTSVMQMAIKLQQEYSWAQDNLPPVQPGTHPYTNLIQRTTTTLTIFLGWIKPHSDWIKINADGAARGYPGIAGMVSYAQTGRPIPY